MPFTEQIQIGFLKFVPWFFRKTEQQDQEITKANEVADQAFEKAIEAIGVAIQAKMAIDNNKAGLRPMTKEEVRAVFDKVFYPKNNS